jgi:uncharacterized protein (TIGR00255 family)
MTGVGFAAGTSEIGDVRVEVRTVNGRSFQAKVRLPAAANAYEAAIETMAREAVRRGTVTIVVERAQTAPPLPDREALRAVAQQLAAIASELALPAPSLQDVLQVTASAGRAEAMTSRPLPPRLRALLEQAFTELAEHRSADGRGTIAAIRAELDQLEALREQATVRAPALVAEYRDRLLQRVREFVAAHLPAPPPAFDVVREVAAFADRVDVAEELQRLAAHVGEVRSVLGRGGEVGRRMEFLLQELLRETNTLGAKSPDAAIAHVVVAMKAAVERMKEQVQNLE